MPVKSAAEYAAHRVRGAEVDDAEYRARMKWATGSFPGEDDDAAHSQVWGRLAPFETLLAPTPPDENWGGEPHRFGELAVRLWSPLLEHEQRCRAVNAFDVCGPLPTGTTVLEASAGTGKTHAIGALVTRYVAEGVGRAGRAAGGDLRSGGQPGAAGTGARASGAGRTGAGRSGDRQGRRRSACIALLADCRRRGGRAAARPAARRARRVRRRHHRHHPPVLPVRADRARHRRRRRHRRRAGGEPGRPGGRGRRRSVRRRLRTQDDRAHLRPGQPHCRWRAR